jgi:hypothetical protein
MYERGVVLVAGGRRGISLLYGIGWCGEVKDKWKMKVEIKKYKPAVTREVLLFLAGALWFSVGCLLLGLAVFRLLSAEISQQIMCGGAGILIALPVHHFGLLKIVDKNLARLLSGEEKKCLFSFMPWKSYLIIPVMITLGILLRHSAIQKPYLAILYVGMGLALLLSSLRYLRYLLQALKGG